MIVRRFVAGVLVFALFSALPALAVAEDDAQWNCRTMGNQVCGEDPVFGTRSITIDGRLYV